MRSENLVWKLVTLFLDRVADLQGNCASFGIEVKEELKNLLESS